MLIYALILCSISLISVAEAFMSINTKTWTYEIVSLECTSTDKDLLIIELKKERISRGVYAITGEFFLKFDIVENDGNTVSQIGFKSYRSPMGDGNYKTLPFQMPSTDWIQYMNTFYKNTIMETIKDCSNLPYFQDEFVPPMAKNQYTLTKCQLSQDEFPSHLEEGIYKVVFYGNGTVNWDMVFIVDIKPNI